MIEKYDNIESYQEAARPTTESRVAQIMDTNAIKIDGVNVQTNHPMLGDAVYKKDGVKYYFKGGDSLNHELLVSKGFEGLGQIIGWQGDKMVFLDKDISSAKYLDVCQYTISAISSTSLSINLRMSPDYNVNTTVNVTLPDTSINSANATTISNAVSSKASEVGDTKDWWAYLDGDKIIIQCDTCVDYRFYIVSGTGCTITHTSWGDMPESSSYFKSNGRITNYRGLMNISRGAIYWGTNGRTSVGTTDVWHGDIGTNDNSLNKATFLITTMYGTGKHQYPTYESYLKGEFGIMTPQNYGCFALPHAKILSQKYGNETAPTKNGGVKYKFPALHYGIVLDRGVDGLRVGDIYLHGVSEGLNIMNDESIDIINATRSKMGHPLISNDAHRWFGQRYGVYNSWIFYGSNGSLDGDDVNYVYQVQGVALLDS